MIIIIGLGANLGDRLGSLRAAADRIEHHGKVRARSHVYETDPVLDSHAQTQPSYLNAALALHASIDPETLMKNLLAIEAAMGRVRAEKNAPRAIDLDVLWIEGVAIASEALTVPHPRLLARAFALGPLLEVEPSARDPITKRAYADVAFDRSALRPFAKL